MKRMVSLLMAVVLLLTLSACGASNEEGATDSTTTTTTHTDGGESTSTTTTIGEDTDASTTEGETTTTESATATESATTTSTENSADKDDSATTATANKTITTKKKTTATTTKKATTTTKKTTTTTATQNNSAVVCTGYEIVKVERPNACYIDGKDILTYFFGENKYFQEGDIITFKLNFSKGSLADCVIDETHSAKNVKISGNTITAQIVNDSLGNPDPLILSVCNKQLEQFDPNWAVVWIEEDNIIWCNEPLIESSVAALVVFEYAKQKYGMSVSEYVTFEHKDQYTYNWYLGKEADPSLTKRHGDDNSLDDMFRRTDVDNWVLYLKWIIDEYAEMGIKRVGCQVHGNTVVLIATKKSA